MFWTNFKDKYLRTSAVLLSCSAFFVAVLFKFFGFNFVYVTFKLFIVEYSVKINAFDRDL